MLNLADLNMYLVIALTLTGGIGVTVFFVGSLVTVAASLGSQRTAWGVACLIFLPFSVIYCLVYWQETQYPRKFLSIGLLLMALTYAMVLIL